MDFLKQKIKNLNFLNHVSGSLEELKPFYFYTQALKSNKGFSYNLDC